MTPKDKYRQLCKDEKTIPIFSKDWWLDADCGKDNWDVLIVEKGGEIAASMPIYIKRKYGIKYITQPILSQTSGIHIIYPENQKYERRLSYEKEVMNEIIDQMEELDVAYYQQNFHYSVTNWLPFYWRGFQQTTRYTYVIEDLRDLDKVYMDFSNNVRRRIKKASKIVSIKDNLSIEEFYNINTMTFDRQNLDIPYSLESLTRLDNSCIKHNCREIFYAIDENNVIHGALYIVWDDNSTYGLMAGANPKYRNSGASTLLVWNAIKHSSEKVNKINFGGSIVEPIENFFRPFGAVQKPYFEISKAFKYKPLFNIYKSMRL